jgi:hypothetical protein
MWTLYKLVFAAKSLHISAPPSAGVGTGVGTGHEEAEAGGAPAKAPGRESRGPREAPDRGSVAVGRSPWRSTSRCMELRRARHGEGRPA